MHARECCACIGSRACAEASVGLVRRGHKGVNVSGCRGRVCWGGAQVCGGAWVHARACVCVRARGGASGWRARALGH
eukprot:9694171-Alexandrium_andersonii.AAC.1